MSNNLSLNPRTIWKKKKQNLKSPLTSTYTTIHIRSQYINANKLKFFKEMGLTIVYIIIIKSSVQRIHCKSSGVKEFTMTSQSWYLSELEDPSCWDIFCSNHFHRAVFTILILFQDLNPEFQLPGDFTPPRKYMYFLENYTSFGGGRVSCIDCAQIYRYIFDR